MRAKKPNNIIQKKEKKVYEEAEENTERVNWHSEKEHKHKNWRVGREQQM